MTKIKDFIVALLAKKLNVKKKQVQGNIRIYLNRQPGMLPSIDSEHSATFDVKETEKFIRSLEKEFNIIISKINENTITSLSDTCSLVSSLRQIAKDNKKLAKQAANNGIVTEFYERTSSFHIAEGNRIINHDGNTVFILNNQFWQLFNVWYSQNKKLLLKNPRNKTA